MKNIINIRDPELIKKIDELKKLFNCKTRTKVIEELVNESYSGYSLYLNYRKGIKNPYGISVKDIIKEEQEKTDKLVELENIKLGLK